MSQMVETNAKSFTSGEALAQWRRVKLSSGTAVYADAADSTCVGITIRAALTSGDDVAVNLLTANGTCKCETSSTITNGALVYAAADGKIASSGTVVAGRALEAATASGDIIEILPTIAGSYGTIGRTNLVQDDLQPFGVDLFNMRVHDAPMSLLGAAATADDLGVVAGTFGTDDVMLSSSDSGGADTTQYGRFRFVLPAEYVDGETVTIRIKAGMDVVADTSATLDVQCYDATAPTVDICATAAQSINSATAANKDFTITPTGLAAGDTLDVRLTVAISDSGNAADDITAEISAITVLCDIKG